MPPSDSVAPPSRRWVPVAVGAVVALTFLPILGNGFVNWDDDKNITLNHGYRGLGPEQLRWIFTSFLMGHYHPLTWLTLAVDYLIWGMDPFGFHLTSLLLHVANAVLLYRVISELLSVRGGVAAPWAAAAGTLLYAVHPLRVESVAWVTERRDVLCGFFALLSVLAYLRHARADGATPPDRKWLILSLVAFAASLLSKALSLALPAVLLILDIVPLGRWAPGSRRRLLLEKLPFLLLSIADVSVMIPAMRHIDAVRSVANYNVVERVAQAAYGLCFYLVKTVWPYPLLPLYRIDSPLHPGDAKYVLSILGVLGVSVGLVALWRRSRGPLAAWVAYIALVFPVLGVAVTGLQIAADRYTYLSLIPLSVLAAAALARVERAAVAKAASAVLVAAFAVTAALQCRIWKDSVALWTHQIDHDPGCNLAWNSRGVARLERGDSAGALEDCGKAAALVPDSPHPRMNLGLAYAAQGRWEDARREFDAALERDSAGIEVRINRGIVLSRLGRVPEALADFDAALERDPTRPDALKNRGVARLQQGNMAGADADLTAAIRYGSRDAETYAARGGLRGSRGDMAGAIADFERALQAAPPGWSLRREVEYKLEVARRRAGGR